MNCSHVLGLIDAGPYADYPPAHLDAAWRHARGCPTCGPALELSTVMTRELAGPMPATPPAHLAASVAARIARLDAPHRVSGAAEPARPGPAVAGWWPELSAVVGGVMAGVALIASVPPGGWTMGRFAMLWEGWTGVDAFVQPATSGGMLTLAGGVLFFVVGLFASRERRRV